MPVPALRAIQCNCWYTTEITPPNSRLSALATSCTEHCCFPYLKDTLPMLVHHARQPLYHQKFGSFHWRIIQEKETLQTPKESYNSTRLTADITPLLVSYVTRPTRVFSHDVTAAILVSQTNEIVNMLVFQTSPVGVERFCSKIQ